MSGPRIFHLTTPEAWTEAERAGRVVPAGFEHEGFVPCSTLEQLTGTISRHLAGEDELRLLELDPADLGEDLRWEESRPGEVYPHLYRPIETADVRAVWTWHRDPDGAVRLPSELT
jgi:uncharacterized protein (DUF952 family)